MAIVKFEFKEITSAKLCDGLENECSEQSGIEIVGGKELRIHMAPFKIQSILIHF